MAAASPYKTRARLLWNSYTIPFTIGHSNLARRSRAHSFIFGAVMKDHPQSGKVNSYSPLMYILLLLMVGIFVKTGVAIQMYQLN